MERFDGYSIDSYALRFAGQVDLEYEEGSELRFGDNFMLVAFGKVGLPTLKEDSAGDIKRIHVLKPDAVGLLGEGDLKSSILTYLGVNEQLELGSASGHALSATIDPKPTLDESFTPVKEPDVDARAPKGQEAAPAFEEDDETDVEVDLELQDLERVGTPADNGVDVRVPFRGPRTDKMLDNFLRT